MSSVAPEPIRWVDERLELLDQTQLPERVVFEAQTSLETVYTAIRQLKVRGAPAIGIAAAYGLVVAMQSSSPQQRRGFLRHAAVGGRSPAFGPADGGESRLGS